MIHPATHIVAAAMFAGCPDDVAPAVAASVLDTAAMRLRDRGESDERLRQWADDIRDNAGLNTPSSTTP